MEPGDTFSRGDSEGKKVDLDRLVLLDHPNSSYGSDDVMVAIRPAGCGSIYTD